MSAAPKATLLEELEKSILDMLEKPRLPNAEKLKAIEAGVKVLAIKHKIDGGGQDGAFFGNRK